MATSETIYLVDASNFVFRAYHAIRGLSNSAGLATGAVFGFTNAILKLVDEDRSRHLAIVFDPGGESFRSGLYPDYKANRPPAPEDLKEQFPYVERVVAALRLPTFKAEGFEADDVIATLCTQAVAAGHEVVILSSDKDLMQLVGEHVTMLDAVGDRRFDPAAVTEKWGVPPARILDLLALMGDSADNIPGVRGIGAKGAAELLQRYGSLEGIYENLEEIRGKRRENLESGRDAALLSRRLAALRYDVPVRFDEASLRVGEPDKAALHALFSELEFRRLAARFAPSLFDAVPAAAPVEDQESAARVVDDESSLAALVAALARCEAFAFDLETTSLSTVDAEIVGFALATSPHRGWYVPVGHYGLESPRQLALDTVIEALRPALADTGKRRYAQNYKYDEAILHRYGVEVGPVDLDPMLASYLLEAGVSRHNLDELAARWLGHKTIKYAEVTGKGKDQIPFAMVAVPRAAEYAAEDARVAFALAEAMRGPLEENGLTALLRDVEIPLARVLGRMELAGLAADADRLRDLSAELGEAMGRYERAAHEAAGFAFNLGSPKQLGEVLFDRLALPTKRKTKTGRATDSSVLEELLGLHPLPAIVLDWRRVQKLRSTYAEALPRLVHPRTGRIHSSFLQAVAATGRLASADPNLQNIPVRTAEGRRIRAAFVAPEGSLLLSADYSQIELRLLAHLSGDAGLVKAFTEDADVHVRTAAEVYGVAPEAVTREQRNHAKAINFGIIYGMGAHRLAGELGISRVEAKSIIDRYFERYAGVRSYLDRVVEEAREQGEVRTLLGRRRLLADIRSSDPRLRSLAERTAINTPVQGSAADVIKLAMLRVDAALRAQGLRSRMVLQVHDELLFEVPEPELGALERLVREAMEGACSLRVPLRIDIHSGKDWSEAHG